MGIGHVEILDLDDGLLQFSESDNIHVWSHKKHKNITRMHRIVNSYPNKKIMTRVKALDCLDKHRVPIPQSIKKIDKFLINEVPAFVEYYDIAKVEVITWKKRGVPQFKKTRNKTLM